MNDCVFCKIINGQIPSSKWWENEDFLVILDINPNIQGASLFIPKKHTSSDITSVDTETLKKAMEAIKTPIEKLKKHFKTTRVGLAVDGTGVDHFHIKMYPFIGYTPGEGESDETVYFEEYPGFVTTKLGPRADMKELEELAKSLASSAK